MNPIPDPRPLTPSLGRNEADVLAAIVNSGGCWIGAREVSASISTPGRHVRERLVRYIVKDLIAGGHPIVSRSGNGGGFRYVTDPEEIELCRLRWMREAKSLLWKASRFDRSGTCARLVGQLEIATEESPHPQPLSRPAGEGGRRPGEGFRNADDGATP